MWFGFSHVCAPLSWYLKSGMCQVKSILCTKAGFINKWNVKQFYSRRQKAEICNIWKGFQYYLRHQSICKQPCILKANISAKCSHSLPWMARCLTKFVQGSRKKNTFFLEIFPKYGWVGVQIPKLSVTFTNHWNVFIIGTKWPCFFFIQPLSITIQEYKKSEQNYLY